MSATLSAVPAGHVAAVVTYLEMDEAPAEVPSPASPLRLEHWAGIDPDRYRALFRRVGSHWLWFSRLAMSDAELLAKDAEVHVVTAEATDMPPPARTRASSSSISARPGAARSASSGWSRSWPDRATAAGCSPRRCGGPGRPA